MGRALVIAISAATLLSCDYFKVKVPITDVNAAFDVAEADWFEQEETMFVFYRLHAEQGLGELSQLEITWRTDTNEQPWTKVADLPTVHEHVAVDCGVTGRCGSTSLHIPDRPRDVRLRLRYHRDGELFLDAPLNFNAIATGAPHTNRSLIVYGVMDETNTRVQWRARHQFPGIRNEEAQDLGLRRHFVLTDESYGTLGAPTEGNPYGYGFDVACPADFTALGWPKVETSERAVFHPDALSPSTSTSAQVCGLATVFDARGSFTVSALARKNPEVAPAFPLLHSPIEEDLHVGFMLRMCQKTISEPHRAMQLQRLLLQGAPEICIDDWQAPGFASQLASKFKAEIDAQRTQGRDMVLLFSLHHDDVTGQLAQVIETALQQILPFERDKSSPRVSGAFVFDSYGHTLSTPELRSLVLWCPANAPGDDLDGIPAASERSCAIVPDFPDLKLGPFKFNQVPILPTRAQYLTFINKYSEDQAGKTRTLTFRAPVRTPLSDNVPLGDFGVATFFNNEVMTAAVTDRFSYCAAPDGSDQLVVFRVPAIPDTVAPLSMLPEIAEQFPQTAYGLGLAWDFPFLMRLEYEVVAAGAATAASFTVPFGIRSVDSKYYGTEQWLRGDYSLKDVLLRCTRFCDHPTFDSNAIYQVNAPFVPTYRQECYRPRYPQPGDGGFPDDP